MSLLPEVLTDLKAEGMWSNENTKTRAGLLVTHFCTLGEDDHD